MSVRGSLSRAAGARRARVSLLVFIGVAFVGAGLALLLSAILGQRSNAAATLKSTALLERVTMLESSVVDAETGLRGYVITGDRVFLAPLTAAGRAVRPSSVRSWAPREPVAS